MAEQTNQLILGCVALDAAAVENLIAALDDGCPPSDFSVDVTDESTRGAFEADWYVGLAISFPLGIAGNLVAAWIWDRIQKPGTPATIVFPDGERIDIKAPDARTRIEAKIAAVMTPASPSAAPAETDVHPHSSD